MKRLLCLLLLAMLLPSVNAFGEIQTITHTVKQVFGGSQSPDDARIAAVAKAKREALEMAGTYIESTTIVRDSAVAKDEIIALSAGILKAEVVSQKNFLTGDAFGMEVTVRVDVDTSLLSGQVKKMLEDRKYVAELAGARLREKDLLKRIDDLEKENLKLKGSAKPSPALEKKFKTASRNLVALATLEKSLADRSNALRDYTRTSDLYKMGLVTTAQMEESKARYDNAVESVRQADAAVKAGMTES